MEFVQSSGSARRRLALHALETKQKEKGNKHQSTGSRRAAVRIRAAPPFFWWKGWGAWKGGAREGSYLSLNCRWRLRLFKKIAELSKKKKSRQEKKQNSKEAFNLERSAVPTKDCKKLNRECGSEAGTGTATKPKAEPARGQHWLLLSPLARVRDPLPKEARSAGGDLGRPATSGLCVPGRSFQGSCGSWQQMLPGPCQPAAFLSRCTTGS